MGQYNEMIITNEGLSLLAKAQLEAGSMIFTSVKTGNGTYNGSEDLRSEISLKSVKNSFQVSSVEQEDSSKLKLRCLLSNDEVSIGYDISEIGVYGKTDQSEEEKMIGIATAVKPDFFPSHDVSPSSILFEIYIKIANCSNVNFEYTIPEGVYELAQNAEEKYKKLEEHTADKNNPHNVTAEGIGAASVTHTHDDRYYTESEIDTKLNGKLNTALRGSANGLAELDATGKVPSTQLPSFVDDVIEGYLSGGKFYMESAHTTQITGEAGKIYIDLSTEKTYRWSGSAFVVISDTIALGETSATAYRGDRGKTAYDHSQAAHARTDATKVEKSTTNGNIKINGTEIIVYTHPSGTNPHGTTKSDIGLSNVGNFKAVSTVFGQGLTDTEKANARSNIGAGTADVDSALSSTSTNPVQNKVVKTALDDKANISIYGDDFVSLGRKSGTTVGDKSFAFGDNITASGNYSHAEGYITTASGGYSHAEGYVAKAFGTYSHAEGYSTYAGSSGSHAEGHSTSAVNDYAHAEGYKTYAGSFCSHAEGHSTTATNFASHVGGKYNAEMGIGGTINNKTGHVFVIGNGISSSALSNAFSIMYSGVVKAASTITASTTADYAEFFEWEDGNPDAEDRVGKFVTLNGDKISIATSNDYILGIVSGEPFVLGNGDCDTWNGMYLRDEFGRTILEPAPKIEIDEETGEEKEVLDEDGNIIYEGTRPVLNPDYDPTQQYISRFDRPEWSPVGMLGVLSVIQDGTCKVNGYCCCNSEGIATSCDRNTEGACRIIEVIDDKVARVIFR